MSLATAFTVGLLGGGHCIGMCGGIVGALTLGLPEEKRGSFARLLPFQVAYNLGRISSYVIAGALIGGMGVILASTLPVYYAQRLLLILAGVFMLLLGLHLGGWWSGLTQIERLGGGVWRRLEPMARRLLPVRTLPQAYLLGLVWGWIPCGLVYSALIWTASAGSALEGAALMLAFGVGTLPNLIAMGAAAGSLGRWMQRPLARYGAGAVVVLLGLYTLWRAL